MAVEAFVGVQAVAWTTNILVFFIPADGEGVGGGWHLIVGIRAIGI